jgi:hypothetical protein
MPQMVTYLLETEAARNEVCGDCMAQSMRPVLSQAQAEALLSAPRR